MKDVTTENIKKRIETLMRVRKDTIKSINAYQQELRKRENITNQNQGEYKALLIASQFKDKIVYETE